MNFLILNKFYNALIFNNKNIFKAFLPEYPFRASKNYFFRPEVLLKDPVICSAPTRVKK